MNEMTPHTGPSVVADAESSSRPRSATEDSITGLPNERALQSLLGSAVRRSGRTGYPLSVMRVDVDGLAEQLDQLSPTAART